MSGGNSFAAFAATYQENESNPGSGETNSQFSSFFMQKNSVEGVQQSFSSFFATAQKSSQEFLENPTRNNLIKAFSAPFGENKSEDIDIESQLDAPNTSPDSLNNLSRSQKFKSFVLCLLLSGFFFSMAIFFFPTVIIMPQKFAFCFTMGSILFMLSFAIFQGPSVFARNLISKDSAPFLAAYIFSILGTIYSTLFWKNYFIILFCSGAQVTSLLWYGATYLPGGRMGLQLMFSMIKNVVSKGLIPCCKMGFNGFKKLFN
eukprot:snap_masked-scaffold_12-processed-gene-0.36-mRNA-1 protein AED:0.69 eAED:0.70 QI:0/-1/0/1/-1/1/1/0/259